MPKLTVLCLLILNCGIGIHETKDVEFTLTSSSNFSTPIDNVIDETDWISPEDIEVKPAYPNPTTGVVQIPVRVPERMTAKVIIANKIVIAERDVAAVSKLTFDLSGYVNPGNFVKVKIDFGEYSTSGDILVVSDLGEWWRNYYATSNAN